MGHVTQELSMPSVAAGFSNPSCIGTSGWMDDAMLVTCDECGALVLGVRSFSQKDAPIDSDAMETHREWHRAHRSS